MVLIFVTRTPTGGSCCGQVNGPVILFLTIIAIARRQKKKSQPVLVVDMVHYTRNLKFGVKSPHTKHRGAKIRDLVKPKCVALSLTFFALNRRGIELPQRASFSRVATRPADRRRAAHSRRHWHFSLPFYDDDRKPRFMTREKEGGAFFRCAPGHKWDRARRCVGGDDAALRRGRLACSP